jgi:thiamine-phosphate pyrophosphorylase
MNRKRDIDYSLYVIADRALAGERPLQELVARAIDGGATIIQHRDRESDDRVLYEDALALREVTKERSVPFIVNDRIDMALAVGADGVHLGQADMPPEVARRLLDSAMILGLSTHSIDEAETAAAAAPDYIAIGPIFRTSTKQNALLPKGTEIISRLKAVLEVPVVAIGGIDRTNASLVGGAGADGIAVISAVIGAEDTAAAARELLREFRRSKRKEPWAGG